MYQIYRENQDGSRDYIGKAATLEEATSLVNASEAEHPALWEGQDAVALGDNGEMYCEEEPGTWVHYPKTLENRHGAA